nr:hypothetical protein [Tanacetum cinerariifolium]
MTSSHNQSISDVGSENRPLMLKKGSYIPWASLFLRYIDGNKDYGKMLKDSIYNGLYQMKEIMDPGNPFTDIDGNNAIPLEYQMTSIILLMHARLLWRCGKEQNENNVNASRVKRASRTHDPLALVENHYVIPSSSHTSLAYDVTHPPPVNDFMVILNHMSFKEMQAMKGHLKRCPKLRVRDSNYFKEQMLLAKRDEVDGEEELGELNSSCIMMARIQTVDNNYDVEPSYDFDFANEVHDSSSSFINDIFSKSDHEQCYHDQPKSRKPAYDDDQIDSDIIFDDPNMEPNSEKVKKR